MRQRWVIILCILLLSVGCLGSDGVTTTTLVPTTSVTTTSLTTTTFTTATTTSTTTTTITVTTTSTTTTSTTTTTTTSSTTTITSTTTTATTSISPTTTIDPYLRNMVQVARGAGDDIIGIINEEEMDRLYGVGFTDRFIETIDRGTLIIFALEEYKKREGMYPQALDDLTPDILESIPGTTLIQHKEIRYSPYWTNNDDTPEYFEEYQKFWYYPSDDLSSFGLVFSGPNEYCNGASWSLDSRNVAETYPFICNTQSILMRLEPPKFTQRFETQEYVFYVPPDWKDSTEVFSNPFDPFEAYFLGLGEFPIRYNNSPVDVKFWMFPEEGTLEEITNGYIDGYYINPDRVFPENFQVKSKKIYLSSGEEANFVHVRFYRKSKGLNQSRFDLITVNPRDGQGYAMTLSIQYFGDYHKVEDDLKLIEFAEQLFNTFKFKS